MAMKVGQPIKYPQAVRLKILNELEEYIKTTEYPTMPKFAVLKGIPKQRIYEWANDEKLNSESKPLGEYFSELIKLMNSKQEAFVEENAIKGYISPTMAIFKLKQPNIAWTDKTDHSLTGDMKISIGLPQEFKNAD